MLAGSAPAGTLVKEPELKIPKYETRESLRIVYASRPPQLWPAAAILLASTFLYLPHVPALALIYRTESRKYCGFSMSKPLPLIGPLAATTKP